MCLCVYMSTLFKPIIAMASTKGINQALLGLPALFVGDQQQPASKVESRLSEKVSQQVNSSHNLIASTNQLANKQQDKNHNSDKYYDNNQNYFTSAPISPNLSGVTPGNQSAYTKTAWTNNIMYFYQQQQPINHWQGAGNFVSGKENNNSFVQQQQFNKHAIIERPSSSNAGGIYDLRFGSSTESFLNGGHKNSFSVPPLLNSKNANNITTSSTATPFNKIVSKPKNTNNFVDNNNINYHYQSQQQDNFLNSISFINFGGRPGDSDCSFDNNSSSLIDLNDNIFNLTTRNGFAASTPIRNAFNADNCNHNNNNSYLFGLKQGN